MLKMFNPILLIAEDQQGIFETAPAVTPTVEATPEPGAGLVGQILNVLTTPTEDNDIPKALNTLWEMAMRGNMYRTVCFLGVMIAVFGVGFWRAERMVDYKDFLATALMIMVFGSGEANTTSDRMLKQAIRSVLVPCLDRFFERPEILERYENARFSSRDTT